MKGIKKATIINWTVFVLVYLFFLAWHGNFSGPLSEAEIERYLAKIESLDLDKESAQIKELLQNYEGGPIMMVNAIELHESPLEINGKKTGESSEEVLRHYSNHVMRFLIKRGSYPLYAGDAIGPAAAMWGIENGEDWTMGAVVRYSNLRVLLDMALAPEFQAYHSHKIAAVKKTIAFPTQKKFMAGTLELLIFFILMSLALAFQLRIAYKN